MRKKASGGIYSPVTSEVKAGTKGRQWRERLTRVGVITSPVKGKVTNAKASNRWTP